eukprot:Skav224552  [mRNA]  locus=scaffold2085:71013:74147:- [translate_table: standard]
MHRGLQRVVDALVHSRHERREGDHVCHVHDVAREALDLVHQGPFATELQPSVSQLSDNLRRYVYGSTPVIL